MNNWLNGIFSTFDPLNVDLHPGHRLIDTFSSCIFLYNTDRSFNESKATYCKKPNEIILESSLDPRIVVIVSDTSIKNNIASSISHIHSFNNLLKKTLHHAINVTPTEAELFAIRCNINQVVQMQNVSCIIVITDAIHAAKKIFNPSMHLHQQQTIVISKDLRVFFSKHEDNTIEFWDCPNGKWHLHVLVDKKIRILNLVPLYPSKVSWDYSEKEECNNIINEWRLTFKLSNLKGRNFLQLLNNNLSEIEPAYMKEGPWLKHFGFSNSLCARATWAITNHTPIGEYHLKFFLREEFKCLCG